MPLAFALTQPALGPPDSVGFNVSTMGTLTNGGASYVPEQWTKHEGHPGWQINTIDNILDKSLATSPTPPDLVTIHLGTNDCNAGVPPSTMKVRMDSLLGHLFAKAPAAQVFLADVVSTGNAWNTCIVAYNQLVPGIVAAWRMKGMRVVFVPLNALAQPMCGAPGREHDLCGGHQVHPTSAGYPRMASAFALTILQNFTL